MGVTGGEKYMNLGGTRNEEKIKRVFSISKKWKPFILFFFLILLMIVVLIFAKYLSGFSNSGQIGDYISGITTPILTFVAVIYAYRSFNKQREQLVYQMEDIKRERFRDTFFQLLNLQNNIIDNLKYEKEKNKVELGRNIFKEIYYEFIDIYIKEKNNEMPYDRLLEHCYRKLDDKHKDKLSHYYKNLYQLFSWIESNKDILEEKDRSDFVKFIRAQLSHYEIHLLFFNTKYYYNKINNQKNDSENERESFHNVLIKYNFFKYDESYDESITEYFDRKTLDRKQSEEKNSITETESKIINQFIFNSTTTTPD